MILFLAILSVGLWLYLLAGHGGFWQLRDTMLPAANGERPKNLERPPFIVAVVPARDEADVVGQAVSSLLEQNQVQVHVVLVDDGSSDGTAAEARRAGSAPSQADRLTIIEGQPLPGGWSGKLWAVQQGLEHARRLNPDFFLLTDADIVHAQQNLGALAARALSGHYDLVSLMVKLHCRSFAERALIPAFVFFFLMLYPPAWIASPRRKTAGAAGGCILIRPEALAKAGGIEAIRREIIDDCALASRVKRSGGRLWLGVTEDAESIRPYQTFSAIGHMISRAAFSQLRHSTLLLFAALAGLTVTYLAPPSLLLASGAVPRLAGAAGWVLMAVCFLPAVRLYKLNPLWSFALPPIALFYMGATIYSAFRFWSGKGGEWKGRVQDPAQNKALDELQNPLD